MSTLLRIKQYIDSKGITNKAFEQSVGFSNGAFASQVKNNRTIGVDKLENILSVYPDINIEWLLTGNGSMLKEQSLSNSDSAVSIYKLRTDSYGGIERQSIPLFEIDAAAGLSTLFSSQNTQIPLDYITVPNAPKCDGAVSVRGDSMYPILKAGDIICYKTITNLDNLSFGEMYLLDIDNGDDQQLLVKFVHRSDKGDDYIKLVSENRYHAPKDIPISYIRALAIVKLSIRYNTIS